MSESKESKTSQNENLHSKPSLPKTPFKMDIFIPNTGKFYSDNYMEVLQNHLEAEGVEIELHGAEDSQEIQFAQIEAAIEKGTNLLFVDLANTGTEESSVEVVRLAKSHNIPILFLSGIPNDVLESYVQCAAVHIVLDEYAFVPLGQLLYDDISKNYSRYDLNGDGKITYVLYSFISGGAATPECAKAIENANRMLKEAGFEEMDNIDKEDWWGFRHLGFDRDQARDDMRSILNVRPFSGENPIELVISTESTELGVVDALNEVGYNLENFSEKIPVFGANQSLEVLDAIKKGMMTGTITVDTQTMGDYVMHLVENIRSGKDLLDGTDDWDVDGQFIRIPFIPVTAENVDEIIARQ